MSRQVQLQLLARHFPYLHSSMDLQKPATSLSKSLNVSHTLHAILSVTQEEDALHACMHHQQQETMLLLTA